jgi:hypothetical protein
MSPPIKEQLCPKIPFFYKDLWLWIIYFEYTILIQATRVNFQAFLKIHLYIKKAIFKTLSLPFQYMYVLG